MVATEQAEGVTEGHEGRGTGLMLAVGLSATAWLHEQPVVRVPWQDVVALSCLRRDSEEDADLPCARGSCLASRVTSCSCELLTDGRWGQSWLE